MLPYLRTNCLNKKQLVLFFEENAKEKEKESEFPTEIYGTVLLQELFAHTKAKALDFNVSAGQREYIRLDTEGHSPGNNWESTKNF
jgi:hypothetical protein